MTMANETDTLDLRYETKYSENKIPDYHIKNRISVIVKIFHQPAAACKKGTSLMKLVRI